MSTAHGKIFAALADCNEPFSQLGENLAKQQIWVKLQELDYWVKVHQATDPARHIVAPTGAQVMELKK